MGRAAFRHSVELLMNARALSNDILLGIVPIALLIALWQALVTFGYAPVSLLPPPGHVFMRLPPPILPTRFFPPNRPPVFSPVCGLLDRSGARRRHRPCRCRQSGRQCGGPAGGSGAGPGAEGGALSGAAAAARLRPRLENHAGRPPRAVSDPGVDLLRCVDGRAETDLVGEGGGPAAPPDPVQGGAARG